MYIENQASRHSPPIAPHYPPTYCGLVYIPGREGGDPPRHRSRDTRQIGGEMHALGLIGPMPHLISKYT